ncbi:MAG TPA: MBL fold metallo-hydrolase, partial [Puia sp.]|nr:MBL fold metallo-hydrolase [Puia sp.]
MSLFITSLNSGSNGNCYYIGNDREAILIDAGLSCRETEKRLGRLGLSVSKIKAIFISHEHTDHIRGLPVLSKKYGLPVYITEPTQRNGGLTLEEHLPISFRPHEPVSVGELMITAFPKFHDAADPYSFVVACGEIKIGVFTDIGIPCEQLITYFQQCHAAFLEANYDEDMLENGSYPIHLKRRIRDGNGHLSNRQALDLFLAYRPTFMSHLLLSHLSHNNNNPDLVRELFVPHADGTRIIIASRYQETSVYSIEHCEVRSATAPRPVVHSVNPRSTSTGRRRSA